MADALKRQKMRALPFASHLFCKKFSAFLQFFLFFRLTKVGKEALLIA